MALLTAAALLLCAIPGGTAADHGHRQVATFLHEHETATAGRTAVPEKLRGLCVGLAGLHDVDLGFQVSVGLEQVEAAIDIPEDYLGGVKTMIDTEKVQLSCFVLQSMVENWEAATEDRRPMCADTGLPRYYVKVGNEARIEGGFVALEGALRRATARAMPRSSSSAMHERFSCIEMFN